MNWLGEASKKFSAMMYIPPEDEVPEEEKNKSPEEKSPTEDNSIPTVNIPPSVTEFFSKAKENSAVWGKSFVSYAKTATKSSLETASKLKDIVQEQTKQTFLGEFDREQSDFMKHLEEEEKNSSENGMPWDDVPESAIAKKQILALSLDSRNFLRAPPSDTKFDLEKSKKIAAALLESDPNLSKIRFQLVPKQLSEEEFWSNYFYRCSLIRKSLLGEGTASANEETAEEQPKETDSKLPETSDEKKDDLVEKGNLEVTVEQKPEEESSAQSNEDESDDSDRAEKIRVLKERMDELKSDDGDWEQELANEIAEYEMVKEETGKDDNWEKEIEDMINEELSDGSK